MKTRTSFLLIMGCCILSLSFSLSCIKNTSQQPGESPEVVVTPPADAPKNLLDMGNSTGNLANGGNFTEIGDWWFMGQSSNEKKLIRMRPDGTEKTTLSEDASYNLNILGDWIYYRNGSDNNSLYRIKTDGSQREKLNDDSCWDLVGSEAWLVYRNNKDKDRLYIINPDGSGRKALTEERSNNFVLYGNWIYYSDNSDRKSVV